MKKKNRFVALVLSLLAPGAGHVYSGHVVQGAWWFGLTFGPLVLLNVIAIFVKPIAAPLIVVSVWLAVTVFLVQVIAAVVVAGRPRVSASSQTMIYAGMWFTGVVLLNAIRLVLIEPYRTPNEAMAPVLLKGDQFLIAKEGPTANWSRGDIVVAAVRIRDMPQFDAVKRVVGITGDTVEVVDGQVMVNDHALSNGDSTESIDGRSWTVTADDVSPTLFSPRIVAKRTLGDGEVYLLGDNRDQSEDSRTLGPYRADSIKGRAIVIWYSPRFARIGNAL